ncbi:MAG: hypothetical protein KF819_16025 [Labilithrix sp.]|nr:hypothetical protein [Labilithrix sp.]
MSDDDRRESDAKRAILARRARFVAAAMASVGVACGKSATPQPCLEPTMVEDAAPPLPCLSPPPTPETPVTDAEASDAQAPPRPCLSVVAPRPDAGATKKR